MHDALKQELISLLERTEQAHAAAFQSTDGADPDWPIWYAEHMLESARQSLDPDLSKSQLIYCLMDAENEHQALAPKSDWPAFYANHLMECHAPAEAPAKEKLALYHYEGCPFCSIARRPIEALGLEVELRDILQNPAYREELASARGRTTVPVLRITGADGEDRWMPESRDIVHYIESTYG